MSSPRIPTDDQLRQFLAGGLPPDEADAVAVWLDADPAAADRLVRLDDPHSLARVLRDNPTPDGGGSGRAGTPIPLVSVGDPATDFPAGYVRGPELGRGGMGVVYRARDTAFGRDVAVKVLSDAIPAHSPVARRFLDEARITGGLPHPGIPAVHQLGRFPDGRPFLAMRLIEGQTLQQLLDARPHPAADHGRFVTAFEAVCQAVGYAHSRGVIHRDLKPQNVMVGAFGEVQVLDWGLAKRVGEADEPSTPHAELPIPHSYLTTPGAMMGTPAYLAPEQARGEADRVDRRSDVFGLGAVLCAILTGQPPYVASGSSTTKQLALAGDVTAAFARLDGCGAEPELVALAKRCLSPDPAERPADGKAVADTVKAIRDSADERARRAETDRAEAVVRAVEERKRQRVRRWATAIGAVSLVLAAAAVALGALYRNAEHLRGVAEGAEGEAKAAEGRAELARTAAEAAKTTAVAEKKNADQARDAADQERKKVEALNAVIESFDHGKTIQMAHQAWRDGDMMRARALLAGTKPALRGWEYRYLHRLLHGELLAFQPHTGLLHWAAYSSDGSKIVTAGSGKTGSVRVWDAKTGKEQLTIKATQNFDSASFSPDDKRIAGLSGNRTVHVWDAKTGDELVVLKGVNGVYHPMTFAAWSPDGSRIVTGSWDKTARVFDAKTGSALFALKGHTNQVQHASFNGDGTRIVTASQDGTVRVWEAASGDHLLTIPAHGGGANRAWFTPNGARIVSGGYSGGPIPVPEPIRVWDAKTGKLLQTIPGHSQDGSDLTCSQDGKRLLTCGGHKVRVWDIRTGLELIALRGFTGDVRSAVFSPDGTRILTASNDRTVRVWDAVTGVEFRPVGDPVMSFPAFFNPDASRILAPSADDRAKVLDPRTGKVLHSLDGHTNKPPGELFGSVDLISATYTADGTRIVTAGEDKTVRVWDAETGKVLATLRHPVKLHSASANGDGSRIVTTTDYKTVRVWDTKSGNEVFNFTVPPAGPKDPPSLLLAVFTPDGKGIVTTGKHVRIWDAATGETRLVLEEKTAAFVRWVSFSADGKRMLTVGDDNTPKVWDVTTGALSLTLRGHIRDVFTAAFHPDGTRIVTAGDAAAILWDATTGAELLTLKLPFNDGVSSAVFSPKDGSRILTAGSGRVKIWDSRPVAETAKEQDAANPRDE